MCCATQFVNRQALSVCVPYILRTRRLILDTLYFLLNAVSFRNVCVAQKRVYIPQVHARGTMRIIWRENEIPFH
jgi:hypothetical protein